MRGRLVTCVLAGLAVTLCTPGVAGAVQPAPCDPVGEYPGDSAAKPAIARWMAGGAAAAGLPAELPVIAALVDSGLANLQSGDSDAVGYFQMRLPIWNTGKYEGYPDKPELQLGWFIDQAAQVRQTGLASGRADPVGAEAQWGEWIADVERPAAEYRGRYQPRIADARELIGPLCMPPGGDPSGGSPAPDAPDPSDVKAPQLALRVTKSRSAVRRGSILLRARCPGEACVIAATGSLRVKGSQRVYKLTSKPRRLARGLSANVALKLSKSLRRAIKRRGAASVRLTVRAVDLVGNVTKKRFSVRVSA